MSNTKTNVLLTATLLALLMPFTVLTQGAGPSVAATTTLFEQGQPFEQDLVITAYYSPLPDQCCYVKGSLAADIELNGEGHHGADGTAVYPGMVAAPPSYPFGTRIVLPGIGTVTVHDRGGAIQEWKSAHRLDLWAGYGEEGLARALAFGVKRVRAVVYPPSSPQPAESISLADLPAPPDELHPYIADSTTLLDIHAELGQATASVVFLQERLKAIGYFTEKASGLFGPATKMSLRKLYDDMGVAASDDRLSEEGAAVIEAAYDRRTAGDVLPAIVEVGSAPARIATAQRTLRFLGFYKGRTNGQYDETFKQAVLAFQKSRGIVASDTVAGAGRIGPKTREVIIQLWKKKLTAIGAQRLLAVRRVDQLIAKRGLDLRQFLAKGDVGENVRALQKFLSSKGYLDKDKVTGKFGVQTEEALIAYQKDSGIIADEHDEGAGYAGPATLARYRQDVRHSLLKVVRARGWAAI